MRDIIFRAKRQRDSKWVYGNYCYAELLNRSGYEHLIIETPADGCSHIVIPETVGQYTGLTDKNGTRIFEGDIVSTDLKRPYNIVVFRDGSFMFNCNDDGQDYYDIMLPILRSEHTRYEYGEVIGNIHDNPKLLRSEEQYNMDKKAFLISNIEEYGKLISFCMWRTYWDERKKRRQMLSH